MKLFLIRHAESLYNFENRIQGKTDSPLTEKGISQSRLLAQRFRNERLDAVYSSTLIRSIETASIILREHAGLPHIKTPLLNERNYGILEGMRLEDALKAMPSSFMENGKSVKQAEGVEPWHEVEARAAKFLNEFTKTTYKTVLAVSHGDFNRALIGICSGFPSNIYYRIPQKNACVNEIELERKNSVMVTNVLVVNNAKASGRAQIPIQK
ncbi:MAG: histidine phosphatase family protein [Candidatus Micrarchaeia archaeon]